MKKRFSGFLLLAAIVAMLTTSCEATRNLPHPPKPPHPPGAPSR